MKKLVAALIITFVIFVGGNCWFLFNKPVKHNINKIKNNINKEYVVEDYKEMYVKLTNDKKKIIGNITKFKSEMNVNAKRLQEINTQIENCKTIIINIPDSDIRQLNAYKQQYDVFVAKRDNIQKTVNGYKEGINRLQTMLNKIDLTLSKCQVNIESIESKKELLESLKGINKVLGAVKGTGDIAINVEILNEDYIREQTKFDCLDLDTEKVPKVPQQSLLDFKNSLKPKSKTPPPTK